MLKELEELQAKIAAKPWPAMGAAFALGMLVAMAKPPRKGHTGIGSLVMTGLGMVALRLVKGYAGGVLGDAAKAWFADRGTVGPTERAASREPAVEAFLEH